MLRNLIYPVPDPAFPFLGVHFTRRLDGTVEAGPNAVLALKREGYRWRDIALRDAAESLTWPGFLRLAQNHWQTGLGEVWRSANKSAFVHALQRLMPNLEPNQLIRGGAGVRAQALRRDGSLADDFEIAHQKPPNPHPQRPKLARSNGIPPHRRRNRRHSRIHLARRLSLLRPRHRAGTRSTSRPTHSISDAPRPDAGPRAPNHENRTPFLSPSPQKPVTPATTYQQMP